MRDEKEAPDTSEMRTFEGFLAPAFRGIADHDDFRPPQLLASGLFVFLILPAFNLPSSPSLSVLGSRSSIIYPDLPSPMTINSFVNP